MSGKVPNLPASNDEYWTGAEVNHFTPQRIQICTVHTKDKYMKGSYKANGDGTMTCLQCPWGGVIPPQLALVNNKLEVKRMVSES